MGDILFSFPFIRALRKSLPDAHIDCVVVPRYAEMLNNNPWIDRVYTLSDKKGIRAFVEKVMFVGKIKKEKYDTCFFLKPSRTKAAVARMAGIPESIGFSGKNIDITREVDVPDSGIHRSDMIFLLAKAMDVSQNDGIYRYFVRDEDEHRAYELISSSGISGGRIVAINPGGNWAPKRWPPEKFVELTKRILDKFEDVNVLITGAEKDIDLAGKIVKSIDNTRCCTVAGKTGINSLAALFKRCTLVISADSGPLHLASASETATIGIFGPTSPGITGTRGKGKNVMIHKNVDCVIPCYVEDCARNHECMTVITVDDVFAEAEKLLMTKNNTDN